MTLDELRRRGAEVPPEAVQQRLEKISPDDLATLVYTSGTTGPPKGCMLTHANLLATTRMYVEQLHFNETHSLYQFLPLAHVLARVAQTVALSVGARVIYWSGDAANDHRRAGRDRPHPLSRRAADLREDPRCRDGSSRGRLAAQRALFEWALACGARGAPGVASGHHAGTAHRRAVPARRSARARRRCAASSDPSLQLGDGRGGADRPRAARVLRRLRRAGARGLRPDRDLRRGHDQHGRRRALRDHRPRAARLSRSRSPRTARS